MLSGFNQYSKPEIELQNRIAGIEIAVNGYVEKENTELYKETLNVTGTKTIEVTYSAQAKNAVATVSGGTLNSAVYYANCCELNITANGKVTMHGGRQKGSRSAIMSKGSPPKHAPAQTFSEGTHGRHMKKISAR